MKALTLTQPWASLVARGVKRIETRDWSTPYRGPLAIHAAAGFSSLRRAGYRGTAGGARDLILDNQALRAACEEAGIVRNTRGQPPYVDPFTTTLGQIVAICDLVDCVPTTEVTHAYGKLRPWVISDHERACGNYSPGRFAWILDNVRPVEPVSPRDEHGRHPFAQGLWTLPEPIVARLRDWSA